ncbi:MAG: ATP-binding protein, partial [Verrucomicrobiota bacterium]
ESEDEGGLARLQAGEINEFEGLFRVSGGEAVHVSVLSRNIGYAGQPAALLQLRDLSQNKKFESALRETAEEVSESTGFSFFYGLVLKLSELLKVDFVTIGALSQKQPHAIETIATCHQDKILDNMTYNLKNTPFENVIGEKLCYYPEDVQAKFPDDQLLQDIDADCYLGIPLNRPDGEPQGLLSIFHSTPLKDPELAINLLQIYAHRATAELSRMHAAEELWESEEKYRSLTNDVLDSSAVGLFILDERFNVVWANQAVGLFFGFEREETIGKDYRDLVKGTMKQVFEQPDIFADAVLSSFRNRTHIEHLDLKTVTHDDFKERWLDHWSQPIRSGLYAGGRIEHFADITMQKKLQSQLLQAQKMESIGRLAGGIAHDFNNLLTSILGFSYLIKDDLGEDHPAQISVDEVIQAGQRAENLTRQLLVFSRKQVTQLRMVDMNSVVVDMDKLLRRTIGENIGLDLKLQKSGLNPVSADPGQLEQVIMNLCINARDAMPKGGSITIETANVHFDTEDCREHFDAEPGDYVMLATRDTGCGMSKEVRDHACEPFFTTKEKGKGTGLGLAIVYGIVQ